MDEVRILTPVGMLGYGIRRDQMLAGLARRPHVITADSGSTDSGPQKLGLGSMTSSRSAYHADLALLVELGTVAGVPIHITSAGGDGTNAHVEVFVDILREIAAEQGRRLRVMAIDADIDKDLIKRRLAEGAVRPLGPVPPLTTMEIDAATNIVAQMGAEPLLRGLERFGEVDVIIAGRAYDPVPIATAGLRRGIDPGLCWHLGKIGECGALCAVPSTGGILGTLRADSFDVEPLDPDARCTTTSVAAHTMYEKTHPLYLPGPGGILDLSECTYEQLDPRIVRVRGSRFLPSQVYAVKLEGAKPVGYRSIAIQGVRDPVFISQVDAIENTVRRIVADSFPGLGPNDYQLIFHIYGKDGVLGDLEPRKDHVPLELCIITEVAAATQERATAICARARVALLHLPYPDRIATAGNAGSPFTPLEIPLGPVCAFNVYHLMDVADPAELFPARLIEL